MSALSYTEGCWGSSRPALLRLAALGLFALLLAIPTPCRAQADDQAAAPRAQQSLGPVYIADVQAGFSDSGRSLARADYFAPARVSLVNRSGDIFTGTVQIISQDRDGETVIYERPGIGIKPSDTADIVLSWFARNAGSSTGEEITVRLLDKDGKLVHSIDVPVDFSPDNEYLIVDLSPRSIKGLIQSALTDDKTAKIWHRGRIHTVSMRSADVPTSWYDLEAADVIVCNQPDEARLAADQVSALAQWVRQGGLLVLGPGSLQSLGQTDLARELPATPLTMAKITRADFQAQGATDQDQGADRSSGTSPSGGLAYPRAVGPGFARLTFQQVDDMGVWQLKPNPGATSLLELPLTRGRWPVLVRRRVGLGSIVQSAINLNLLLVPQTRDATAAGMGAHIKPEIFGIRLLDIQESQATVTDVNQMNQMKWNLPWPNRFGPPELVKGQADFRAAGTLLAVLLMLLTIVYGLVVTIGTWLLLRYRKLTHHSWLAFSLVAVAGSVGAAFLVQAARGISAEVKQESIIDIDAATGMAGVHTFYGLRMPYDARVDLGLAVRHSEDLPPEQAREAYIRPAADLQAGMTDSFAVRRDYTLRYGQQGLWNVPVRATAKQFESYWYGPLGGTIQGSLSVDAGGRQLTSQSWISNQTGMALSECILAFTATPTFTTNVRDGLITIVRIGDLPAGYVLTDLPSVFSSTQVGTPGLDFSLKKATDDWLSEMRADLIAAQQGYGVTRPEGQVVSHADTTTTMTAAMLTLLSDLPSKDTSRFSQILGSESYLIPFSQLPRSGDRWLDMRYVLDGRAAILIGLAKTPGPTRLKLNGRSVEPSSSECVIRAVIPLAGGNS